MTRRGWGPPAAVLAVAMGCSACEPSPTDPPLPSTSTGSPTTWQATVDADWNETPVDCTDPGSDLTTGPFVPLVDPLLSTLAVDPKRQTLFEGGGLAIADLDEDGQLDLVLPHEDGVELLLGSPSGFVLATDHLPKGLDRAVGAVAADLDGDGSAEVVIPRYRRPNSVLQRQPDGSWQDVATAWGLTGPEDARSVGATAGDVDRDGDLDLFLANFGPFFAANRPPGEASYLYENTGDGFVPWPAELPTAVQEGYVFVGGLLDLDEDGQTELYTVHDFGNHYPNVLTYLGDDPLPIADTSLGLTLRLDAMGLDWGDVDGDGDLDLVVAGWSENRLMLQDAGAFYDHHETLGLVPDRDRDQRIGWSTTLADLDNDGDLDVLEGYGTIYNQVTMPAVQPDAVFQQAADGQFADVAADWGLAHGGQTRAVVAVDLDRNGTLDLLRRDLIGPTTVDLGRCTEGAWITVMPRQPNTANPAAIGATVHARAGEHTWTGFVRAGGHAIFSSVPPEVHLGLGNHAVLDEVAVVWPDGEISVWTEVPTRQRLTVSRIP